MRTYVLACAWVAAVAGLSGCAWLSQPPDVRVVRDIAYWRTPEPHDNKHRLDVYLPPEHLDATEGEANAPRLPVLLFVHGGGWWQGDRRITLDIYGRFARRLAARGVIVAVMSYRLAPEVRHPEQARDVARAVAAMAANAPSYGGDPSRLFLMGHSAGAQLAALVALDPRWLREWNSAPARLAGVIALCGPYDLVALSEELPAMVTRAFGWDRQVWLDASPFSHVGDGRPPPFLLAAAEHDPPRIKEDTARLAEALTRQGTPVESIVAADRSHAGVMLWLASTGDPLGERLERFVRETPPAPRGRVR